MSRRTWYRLVFGAATAAAVALELVAAFDGNPASEPWTEHLIRLPWWVLVPLAVGFSVWLPAHLISAKRKGHKPTT